MVVYDSHESFMDSGSNVNRPAWAKWILRRFERRQAAHAVALVTVNRSLGELLGPRFGIGRVVVVYNAPARWEPPAEPPDLLRRAAQLPPGTPIALYHGAFSPHRGLEELAGGHRSCPGWKPSTRSSSAMGRSKRPSRELAAEPRFGGRLHVLKAVSPDVLPAWVASADVGVMAIQASTLNHRLSSPNKLFESIATGLPVVVSDFLEMRRIVLDDPDGPLGAVCDPADPGLDRVGDPLDPRPGPGRAGGPAVALPARGARPLELGDRVGEAGGALRLARRWRPVPATRRGTRPPATAGRRPRGCRRCGAGARSPGAAAGRPSRSTRSPARRAASTSTMPRVS